MAKKEIESTKSIDLSPAPSTSGTEKETEIPALSEETVVDLKAIEPQVITMVPLITDAAIGTNAIYFIKNKRVIQKNLRGEEREVFDFNSISPIPESITIEGFYTENLVFLIDGKLYVLTGKNSLVLLAE